MDENNVVDNREDKLYEGVKIKVWRLGNAGGYSIIRINMWGEALIKELGLGQPFECAYQEAEELAVLIDAELSLNGDIVRKSRKGEYK